ncbi:MAG: hypothetical protein ABFD54_01345 [Armatimonadota bacterium]|nr:hypothetical protein [bacterium]
MKTKLGLFLLGAIFSIGAASAAVVQPPKTVHFEVKVESEAFGNAGTRKMWIKGNKMRWEYKSVRLPVKVVKNNQGTFLIHPWKKIAAKYPKDSLRNNPSSYLPVPLGNSAVFLKHVKATKQGSELINKQKCNVYSYTDPITKNRCKLWVGVKSGKPVRLHTKGQQRKVDTTTVTFTKFVEGEKISDSLFELPKGYAIKPMPEQRVMSKSDIAKLKKKASG